MVKIIEQGYKRLICKYCESVLEYKQSEVSVGKFNVDYLGDYDNLKYIICPSCKSTCIIKE